MSALPDQDKKTAYTEDDVQHIVAREMAKQQLIQLQNGQLETNKRLVEIVSEFKAELKGIRAMLDKTPEEVNQCKVELKNEIKEAHPDHSDLKVVEGQLDKFKHIGYGLTIGAGVIFILAQYIVVDTLNGLKKSIDGVNSNHKSTLMTVEKVNKRVDDLEQLIIRIQEKR